MLQSKKKRADFNSAVKTPDLKATGVTLKGRRTGYIIASVVVTVILAILGVGYYLNYMAPFRLVVIRVDNIQITMDYLLKRTWLTREDAVSMLSALTNEQIIKLEAPLYGIEVSREDVDQQLREIARGESESISESEFKEWYRQQLNESELSDAEFRDFIRSRLLMARLNDYLAVRMPTVAEQVHLYAIRVKTYEEAIKVRLRWEAGENFADLAQEVSLDESKEKGGDLGWLPAGVMDPQFDNAVFDLASGNVSQPVPTIIQPTQETEEPEFYLFRVTEKADARELDEDALQVLRARALEFWLPQASTLHEVTWHGFNNGFDSGTYAWMNWQLSKKQKPTSQETK